MSLITPIQFIDREAFTAYFSLKFKTRAVNGVLALRDLDDQGETHALPILTEWASARALLARLAIAASTADGRLPKLGRAWIETLGPESATPWVREEDDYAQAHIRTRTCLVMAPEAYTCSGAERVVLSTGVVNIVEHRVLCSEINLSRWPRTHLVVDIERLDASA